jgi:prolipoprotein diacylglyceryl transferase
VTTTVLAYIPSPPQGVWYLGPFPLRAYALFIIVGIVAALVLGDRRWVARGGEPGVIYDIALWAVPFGLIGGRLYHVITDWSTYFGPGKAGPVAALRIWDGGLGIWGAVALGGIGAWIACRRRGIPLPAFGDAIAPGIVLAQAIGRLGNYFNQELFGRETTLPWGLEIYERVNSAGQLDMLNGVSTGRLALDYAVHPTFLYELLWNLLVFAVLIVVDRKFKIGHGRLFALYVAGYCVGRFWIELMRSDTATLLAGIRINTFTATFVFIGAVVYIISAPKGREDPATLRGNLDDESPVEEFAVAAAAAATGVAAAAKVADEDEARGDAAVESEPDSSGLDAGGLGTVEGDEAAEAAEGAPAVHDAAVQGAGSAGAVAAQLDESDDAEAEAQEPTATGEEADTPALPSEAGGIGTVEGDEASEAAAGAAAARDAVAGDEDAEAVDTDHADVDATADTGPEGLGSVDLDEVAAAVDEAAEVHEAAVEGEADAEELVAEVEAEPEVEADAEVPAAVGEAAEVHEAAVEGNADAEDLVAEVDAEPDAGAVVPEESESESEGLGSVDGDEVAAAVGDAAEVHEAAVVGEADAEGLVAEVDAEPDAGAVVPEDSDGLGSVDGDEVAAAVGDAADVHEAAVEGEADAEELVAEVESEDDAENDADDDAEAPPSAEAEDAKQITDVDAEAPPSAEAEDAKQITDDDAEDQASAEGADAAEALTADDASTASTDDVLPTSTPKVADSYAGGETSRSQRALEAAGRVRQWVRRRRNR